MSNAPAPKRVRITGCSYEQGWYKNLIGQEFDVDNAGGNYDYILWEDYCRGHNGTWRHISKADCVIVEPDMSPTPSPKDRPDGQNLQRSDFEKLVWSLWEKDGKPQLNMHGYLQGAIAMDRHHRHKESAPISHGEIPEEIRQWIKQRLENFSSLGPTVTAAWEKGVIACYHKMQEEITAYKEMWMIADKTMNELRLKVQELNKITNG